MLAILALAAAKAAEPVAIKPTGPWTVRFEESLCLLERSYPIADKETRLLFQPMLDLPNMEVFVFSPDKSEQQFTGTFKATIGPAGTALTGSYFSVWSARGKVRVTRLSMAREVLDALKDGDVMRVQAKPIDLAFTIVRPDQALGTLKRCIADLKKSWGISPDPDRQAVTPLEGNPASYFTTDSYPKEAWTKGIYGRVIALLNIGADGKVSHCRILSSAGEALNAGTCTAATRIRFKPPRDKDGVALTSTYVLPVRWALPGVK